MVLEEEMKKGCHAAAMLVRAAEGSHQVLQGLPPPEGAGSVDRVCWDSERRGLIGLRLTGR